jgi:multiple antibiotic resistance protein
MQESFTYAVFCLTTFITIVNPISIIPVYLTMTSGISPAAARITALKAVTTAFLTMVFFAFTGKFIFDFFQITTNGLKVAGGIIFLNMGWEMLQAKLSAQRIQNEEVKQYVTDISITPLGIPMICGPGAITNSVLLMGDAGTPLRKLILVGAMLVICLLTLVTLNSSRRIVKVLGDTGNKVLMRIMGLIVMVIAIELFFAGLTPIVREMLQIKVA